MQPSLALSKVGECCVGQMTCILCYRLCYIIYHALLLSLHDIQPTKMEYEFMIHSMNICVPWNLRRFLLMSFIKLEKMVWHPLTAFGMQAWSSPSQQKRGNPKGVYVSQTAAFFSLGRRCGKSCKLAAFATAAGFCRVRRPTFGVLMSLGMFGLA